MSPSGRERAKTRPAPKKQPRGASPRQQLDAFLDRYLPAVAAEARGAHTRLRRLTPGAVEFVYDNYNALVIGFGPTMRPSEAILSIAVMPRWVTLCFLQGVGLPDPHKRLRGSGNVVRHVRLDSAKDLDDPVVLDLIDAALASACVPLDPAQRRQLIIKSISAKQRPRRPDTGGK